MNSSRPSIRFSFLLISLLILSSGFHSAKAQEIAPEILVLYAASMEDMVELESLVAAGAKVTAKDTSLFNYTALHYAAENDQQEMIQFLIEHGAKVNAKSTEKKTPLHSAAEFNCIRSGEALIKGGADVNARLRAN